MLKWNCCENCHSRFLLFTSFMLICVVWWCVLVFFRFLCDLMCHGSSLFASKQSHIARWFLCRILACDCWLKASITGVFHSVRRCFGGKEWNPHIALFMSEELQIARWFLVQSTGLWLLTRSFSYWCVLYNVRKCFGGKEWYLHLALQFAAFFVLYIYLSCISWSSHFIVHISLHSQSTHNCTFICVCVYMYYVG